MTPTDAAAALEALGFPLLASVIREPSEPLTRATLVALARSVWWDYQHVGDLDVAPVYADAERIVRSIQP